MSDPILAWHFVTENRTLRDGQKVRAGRVYRLPKGSQQVLVTYSTSLLLMMKCNALKSKHLPRIFTA